MRTPRMGRGAVVALSALTIAGLGAPLIVRAADHADAPGKLQSPKGRHDADINDLYAFPGDATHTVLAITTHPALGVVTTDPAYATDVSYNVNVVPPTGDTITFAVTFAKMKKDGTQAYTVTKVVGKKRSVFGRGTTNKVITTKSGGGLFAGQRSDPFFFDLEAFNNTVQANGGRSFCVDAAAAKGKGVDFFSTFNTNVIAWQVGNDKLPAKYGVWSNTTSLDGTVQYDRMSRPAINTVFNGFKKAFNSGADADKDEFNSIRNPADDPTAGGGKFRTNTIKVLQALSSLSGTAYTDKEAGDLASALLPDVLPYDTANAKTDGVFNGRAPADDVIDTELNVVTKGAVKSDCVAPHTDYLSAFPYFGNPH